MSRYATASIVVSTALIGGFFATDTSANLYLDCNNPRTPPVSIRNARTQQG